MGKSLVLAIDELAPNQVQAFAVVNDMLGALEAASNSSLVIDTSNPSNYDVAELDFTRYFNLVLVGHTEDFSLVLPETVNSINSDRTIAIINNEPYTVTVETTTPGAVVVLPPFGSAIVRVVFQDVFLVCTGGITKASLIAYIPNVSATPPAIVWTYAFYHTSSAFMADWVAPGVGDVVFTAQPDDTDTITVNDGVKSVTFEFESGGGVGGGNTAVTIGGSFDVTGANLAAAINAADLNVVASYSAGTDTCTIMNLNGFGGSITATSAAPDFTVTTFSGGVNGARGRAHVAPTENVYLPITNRIGDPHGVVRIDLFGNVSFWGSDPETGSILFNAQVDDGDIININDGFLTVSFEFESGGGVAAGNVAVTIGGDQDASATNLRDAIMASRLNVEAIFDATTNTISLLNWNGPTPGGAITKTDADNDMTVTDFTGGTAAAEHVFPIGDALVISNSGNAATANDAESIALSFPSI